MGGIESDKTVKGGDRCMFVSIVLAFQRNSDFEVSNGIRKNAADRSLSEIQASGPSISLARRS